MSQCSPRAEPASCSIRPRCRDLGPRGTLGADARRFVDWLARAASASGRRCRSASRTRMARRTACARPTPATRASSTPRISPTSSCCRRGLDAGGDRDARYASFAALATPSSAARSRSSCARAAAGSLPYGLFEVLSARFDAGAVVAMAGPVPRAGLGGAARVPRGESRRSFARFVFEQYLFELQWTALKRYANERGVYLFGDLPFYVDRNSVEVWWDRRLFALDASGEPLAVAGVPPDYFNADGQLWGNPLYDWDAMERSGFRWWLAACARSSRVSISCASITSARSSRTGRCRPERRRRASGSGGRVAATRCSTALRARARCDAARCGGSRASSPTRCGRCATASSCPAWSCCSSRSTARPTIRICRTITGATPSSTRARTTTTRPSVGTPRSTRSARDVVHGMLGVGPTPPVPEFLIEAAYASNAALAIVPLQDLLGRDSGARMNTPGTVIGNWRWRFAWPDVPVALAAACRERAVGSGRAV